MTKEEQKELLNTAHHLRAAIVHLTQAHVHSTRALRIGEGDHQRLCIEIRDLLSAVIVAEDGVGRKAGPVEPDPRFSCSKVDCPTHSTKEG